MNKFIYLILFNQPIIIINYKKKEPWSNDNYSKY